MNPPDSTAPLTTEQLCSNLLAIKPGDAFECRRVLDSAPYGRDEWTGLHEFPDAVWAVREGYDVRPLPAKRFVLLYLRTGDILQPPESFKPSQDYSQHVLFPDHKYRYLRIQIVQSSSLSTAAALAAPLARETFLAAVPYPEA